MADSQPGNQPGQRDLRGIGGAAKHGFAKEGPAEANTIEAADELALPPAFDRMGMAGGVEAERRAFDLIIDPRLLALRAAVDDLSEGPVAGDREAPLAKRPRQRAGDMEAIEREDRPVARLDPENVLCMAAVGHRENARRITAQQQSGIKAAHG
jgi:hypothetical protein